MIKALLVDDSPIVLAVIKRMLATSPDIKVAGTASNGKAALELISKVKPDVLCTDLHMPVMDGLELTKQVMRLCPIPILVLSISVRDGSANIFKLLEAGAVDVMQKPKGGLESEIQKTAKELITKIKVLSGVKVIPRFRKPYAPAAGSFIPRISHSAFRVVVIGASTGGPQALHGILKGLPADFPLPVVCIQHISDGFLKGLVEWLAEQSRIKVGIAVQGEMPLSEQVYFPQEGAHLGIDENGRFVCSMEPPVYGHRPSITVTMRSLVQYYGSDVIAVLLTGMGSDGAEGMLAVKKAGGVTIAQDEGSSVVFGMPKQAIEIGGAQHVLPLDRIGSLLIRLGDRKNES